MAIKRFKSGRSLRFTVSVGRVSLYGWNNISIRYPNDPFIFESDDQSVLTLVTCYPFIISVQLKNVMSLKLL